MMNLGSCCGLSDPIWGTAKSFSEPNDDKSWIIEITQFSQAIMHLHSMTSLLWLERTHLRNGLELQQIQRGQKLNYRNNTVPASYCVPAQYDVITSDDWQGNGQKNSE